jgi:hypothetical protein
VSRISPRRPIEPAADPVRRSNAAAPLAVLVLFVGLLLGTETVLVPALLGVFLFSSGFSFLSTRVNPFSIGFYLTKKPSWTAIGIIFLSGMLLWLVAYTYFVRGIAPVLPAHFL